MTLKELVNLLDNDDIVEIYNMMCGIPLYEGKKQYLSNNVEKYMDKNVNNMCLRIVDYDFWGNKDGSKKPSLLIFVEEIKENE